MNRSHLIYEKLKKNCSNWIFVIFFCSVLCVGPLLLHLNVHWYSSNSIRNANATNRHFHFINWINCQFASNEILNGKFTIYFFCVSFIRWSFWWKYKILCNNMSFKHSNKLGKNDFFIKNNWNIQWNLIEFFVLPIHKLLKCCDKISS